MQIGGDWQVWGVYRRMMDLQRAKRWIRRTSKSASALLSALSNLATVSAVALAFWAFFFTSVPDDVARQFRSEISDLNEQLVDMRQERRDLATKVDETRSELGAAEASKISADDALEHTRSALSKAQADLQSTQNELDSARATLEATKAERRKYLSDLTTIRWASAFAEVQASRDGLAGAMQDAGQAESIGKYRRWLEEGNAIWKTRGQAGFDKAYMDWSRRVPQFWIMWELFAHDGDPTAGQGSIGGYTDFRNVHAQRSDDVTCRDILTGLLKAFDYAGSEEPARSSMSAFVKNYIDKHGAVLGASLLVIVPLAQDDDAVEAAGKAAATRVEACQNLMLDLGDGIANLVRNSSQ